MKRTKFFSVLALMIIIAALGTASAFGGIFCGMDPESSEDIVNAIEANDYKAWKEAMSNRLTEENFNMLVERHEAISERQAHREVIELAIQEGDYETWKEAVENMNSEMMLDEDDFKILVQLHQASENGDYETLKKLSEQLGLPEKQPVPQRFAEHGMSGRGRMV